MKISVLLLVLFSGCNQSDKHSSHFNAIVNNKKEGMHLDYFPSGEVKAILYYQNDSLNGECVFFYNGGKVKSKVPFINNLENGMAYYFYPSGVIESYREWQGGRKIRYAQDYYDTLGYIKAYMYYNSEGALLWKNTVDVNGKIIKEEGKGNKL
jgi:antitoxin component YwqK of YwqJK toxin-antitoxin module